jgi:hypothetical protein
MSVLILRGVALAADAVAPSAATSFLEQFIQLVGAVLAAVLIVLARKAMVYFEQKTKIDIPANTETMISDWAGKAVDYAKEKAHQYNQANPGKMRGPEKLEVALNFGLELAEQYKIADVAKDKLVKAIEAQLGSTRTGV